MVDTAQRTPLTKRLGRVEGTDRAPSWSDRSGAVLRADVVGFTELTDRMAEEARGSERLAELLQLFFTQVTDIAAQFGGELVVVAGDAALFAWFVESPDHLDSAAAGAAAAGLAIQREISATSRETGLRLRCSVGAGPLVQFEVGSVDAGWHTVLSGAGLSEALRAGETADPGSVVLGASALGVLRASTGALELRVEGSVLRSLATTQAVPDTHSARPAAANGGLAGTALFRHVTAAFIVIRDAGHVVPNEALELLQEVISRAGAHVKKYDGEIGHVRIDENGITLVALFGVPVAHESDALRATQAAIGLHREWGAMGLTSSAGLATGRVHISTAEHGGPVLVGPVMNLAARLMQLNAGVVCDGATVQAAKRHRRMGARALAPRFLKGKSAPTNSFVPFLIPPEQQRIEREGAVVGRDAETSHLREAVTRAANGLGSVLVVEGEAGIGKSTLIDLACSFAELQPLLVLRGFADETERTTPYFAWRPILRALFGLDQKPDRNEIDARRLLESLGDDVQLAPLVAEHIGIAMGDSVETLRLSGEARAAQTTELFLRSLAKAGGERRVMVVLEDAHWFDSSTWSLLAATIDAGLPLLVLVASRPVADASEYARLIGHPRCQTLHLAGLNLDETMRLIAGATGATRVSGSLSELITKRTGGNPLFIGEITPMLVETGVVMVVNDEASFGTRELSDGEFDSLLASRGLSTTLEGIVLARFDRLTGAEKAVLKAASVAGQNFAAEAIGLIVAGETASMIEVLEALVSKEFLARSADEGYEFKHIVFRNVVYASLTFADRHRLHARTADGLDRSEAGRLGRIDALLAHHFSESGNHERAVPLLIRAGHEALRNFAINEAITLAESAVHKCSDPQAVLSTARRLHEAELLLGRAYLAQSYYQESKRHSQNGLAIAGNRFPRSASSSIRGVLVEVLRQAKFRFRTPAQRTDEADRNSLSARILALEGLAEIYFYEGDGLKSLYASLKMLNLAERLGPSPELARAYAAVSGIAGLIGLDAISSGYRRRSLEMLDLIQDPAASAWALNLLGISQLGKGRWADARDLFRRTGEIAGPLGERRRWRDSVENGAVIEGCLGRWEAALSGFEAMRASASSDRDQRYVVLADRGIAVSSIHLGRFDLAQGAIDHVGVEVDRGLKAEEQPTRQDLHAVRATLALERGCEDEARSEAARALAVAAELSGPGSFANRYWSIYLLGRVFLHLDCRVGPGPHRVSREARHAVRLIRRLASTHPIATPAAGLLLGGCLAIGGHRTRALRAWRRAEETASALGMNYETAVARAEVAGVPTVAMIGLPFLELARQTARQSA